MLYFAGRGWVGGGSSLDPFLVIIIYIHYHSPSVHHHYQNQASKQASKRTNERTNERTNALSLPLSRAYTTNQPFVAFIMSDNDHHDGDAAESSSGARPSEDNSLFAGLSLSPRTKSSETTAKSTTTMIRENQDVGVTAATTVSHPATPKVSNARRTVSPSFIPAEEEEKEQEKYDDNNNATSSSWKPESNGTTTTATAPPEIVTKEEEAATPVRVAPRPSPPPPEDLVRRKCPYCCE